MPATFNSPQERDRLAHRLASLAVDMRRAWDQGSDGRIYVNDEMIEDIQTAALVVGSADTLK